MEELQKKYKNYRFAEHFLWSKDPYVFVVHSVYLYFYISLLEGVPTYSWVVKLR